MFMHDSSGCHEAAGSEGPQRPGAQELPPMEKRSAFGYMGCVLLQGTRLLLFVSRETKRNTAILRGPQKDLPMVPQKAPPPPQF